MAAAVALGYVWGNSGSGGASIPALSSVDAGFARDMSTHHSQAVTMASYERDNTTDPAIKVLAYDIETSADVPDRRDAGLARHLGATRRLNPSPMAWMAGHGHLQSDGLMPGMATPAQMNKLETLHGKALDIFFLQLMIHHHQGGMPMAQYAAQHATEPYVRDLAQSMVNAQSSEIVSMEQLLRSSAAPRCRRPTTDRTGSSAATSRHRAATFIAPSRRRPGIVATCRAVVATWSGLRHGHGGRCGLARLAGFAAPVAQGIEHRPPEAVAQVRILPGAPIATPVFAGPRWALRRPPP